MKTPILMCPPEAALHMEYLLNAKFGGYLWLMMGTKETFMTVGGFDENLPRLQDLDFFIRFCQKGGIFYKIGSDEAMCIYYKDDVSRGAMSVWKSWTHIWKKHRLLYYSFGYNNAFKWRHHHFRVARRFAKANRDWNTYIIVSTEELIFRVVKFIKINFCGRA